MNNKFGATYPPSYGGNLRTRNSNTGKSDRYTIHETSCNQGYKQSKGNGNIISQEADTIEEMVAYLKTLSVLAGGIKLCGHCLKHMQTKYS